MGSRRRSSNGTLTIGERERERERGGGRRREVVSVLFSRNDTSDACWVRLGQYDWRQRERLFNDRLPQYRTVVSASSPHPPLRLHFVHKRSASTSANVIPLLYCHSWPGGIIEVVQIIDLLTTASTDGETSFHVVIPSIPGCGFSEADHRDRSGTKGVAEIFDRLMQRLGYRHYVAHGTGWYVISDLSLFFSSFSFPKKRQEF